ncbi:maltose acetyltransferase [Metarhizobium album]|uniref:Maltose acetyltransferase n=1 Tax=Metarhizobium album TaxID=2182425 RepID=A0A2U2DKM1_9HYPH|nr:sugar O-acetyltransferase [Rhizobium album]PWE53856.1 maltose acetyltransferase [Rhizobium album]
MAAGEWYNCLDPELDALRWTARAAVHAHNNLLPSERGALAPALRTLLAEAADDCFVEAPFHCAYGLNIHLGRRVYLNAGCVILDSAKVRIGDGAMLGPSVHIYCADHHRDVALRKRGIERARPVEIGADAWIGGGAIILPGITIGAAAIVGAGAVVTRDVAAGATVAGNPARAIGNGPAGSKKGRRSDPP